MKNSWKATTHAHLEHDRRKLDNFIDNKIL